MSRKLGSMASGEKTISGQPQQRRCENLLIIEQTFRTQQRRRATFYENRARTMYVHNINFGTAKQKGLAIFSSRMFPPYTGVLECKKLTKGNIYS